MQSYNARLASFNPSHRSKSSKVTPDLRWPHPDSFLANPKSLASAGFYFNPSAASPDAVSCFMCDKGLTLWDPDDDPVQIHAEKCPKCAWAIVKCVKNVDDSGSFKFPSSSRLPSSRTMEKARLATFGPESKRWWPHDAKNKSPTSKMMARAGFIYTPMSSKDDTCICIYCGTELNGWQREDDPMEEHRKRQSSCPFFTASSANPAATKHVRSKSKPPPTTPAAPSSDEEYHPPSTRSSTRASSSRQPSGSAKPKPAAKFSKKNTKGKTTEKEVVAEYHIALDMDEDAPPKPRPKPRRVGSRSRSRSQASSAQNTTADETETDQDAIRPDNGEPVPLSTLSPPHQIPQVNGTHHLVPPATAMVQHHLKSFQSPEDEEFALEEQALEEQARELMLADVTFQLASTPADGARIWTTQQHHESMRDVPLKPPHGAPTVDKGKGKAKIAPIEDDSIVTEQAAFPTVTPSTPPPHTAPVGKAALPPVVKFPQILPDDSITTLTDVERAMTVEQWIRHEMDRQYERLRSDGRQKIDAFKARAIEVAKQLEHL